MIYIFITIGSQGDIDGKDSLGKFLFSDIGKNLCEWNTVIFLSLVFQIMVQRYSLSCAVWETHKFIPCQAWDGRGSTVLILKLEYKKHFLNQYKDKGLFIKPFWSYHRVRLKPAEDNFTIAQFKAVKQTCSSKWINNLNIMVPILGILYLNLYVYDYIIYKLN